MEGWDGKGEEGMPTADKAQCLICNNEDTALRAYCLYPRQKGAAEQSTLAWYEQRLDQQYLGLRRRKGVDQCAQLL